MFDLPMRLLKRLLASLLRIVAGVPIVSLLALGLIFSSLTTTFGGRSVGLSLAILGVILYCSVGYWNRPWFRPIRKRFYAVLLPVGLSLYVSAVLLGPDGGTGVGRVRNCYLRGQGNYCRVSPWNAIPEIDQIGVGVSLLRLRDVGAMEGTRMLSLMRPAYAAMESEPEFRELGSALGAGYRELIRAGFRTGHYFLFLPEAAPGEKLPCIVYLHGLGGNTRVCLWLLSRQARCAVIAPTFGIGNWDNPAGAELAVDVVREALASYPLDAENIFLMGYSNGAMGVTRAAMAEPELFRGLIYLSPVTEDEFFSTEPFLAGRSRWKILFLHGSDDVRIPLGMVQGTAATLKGFRFDVRLKAYDGEDHYLLFSQPQAVVGEILQWIAER